MGQRKGVYAGFWCPPHIKQALTQEGERQHRTLSQEIIYRLEKSLVQDGLAAHEAARQQREEVSGEQRRQ